MRITWSVPVFSQALDSGRGDLVRAAAMIEALRSGGHDVRVVEASRRPGRELDESLYRGMARRRLPDGIRLTLRDVAWWWRSREHGRRVAEVARRQGADLLVETQVHGVVSGSVAARATGLPLVLDDVSPVGEIERLGAGLPALSRAAFERQRAAAALLVVPTTHIADRLETGRTPPHVTVIPNGVDLEAHRRVDRDAARRALGLREEVLIGFVGSFQPWHDVPLLVRSFAGARTRAVARLLLVGDGPGREPALAEARSLGLDGRVIAPGSMTPDRVPELLGACDVGVLAGTNEYGQPMKLLEYGAAGLASVAPDLLPVRDVIENGVSGLLFAPGDHASLTRALEELIDAPDRCHRLGAEARSRIAAGDTWTDRARRLVGAVHRAVAAGGPAAPSRPAPRAAARSRR